jgi:hypothetical protein
MFAPQAAAFASRPAATSAWAASASASASAAGPWSAPAPAPAPFPGPPPMPSGAGISQQAWTAGQWIYNPAFRPPMTSASQFAQQPHPHAAQQGMPAAWAPWLWPGMAQAQAQAQAAGQGFNPYKRTPKEPPSDYYATKLSTNPLGLSGMDIRRVHARARVPKKGAG